MFCPEKSSTDSKDTVTGSQIKNVFVSKSVTEVNFGEPCSRKVSFRWILFKFNGLAWVRLE